MAANEALWASMRFADMTPAGVDSLARSCGWRVKWKRGEPFVAPEECFSGAPAAPLLSADRLVFAENADDPSVYAYIAKQCCPTRSMNTAMTRWMEMKQGVSCSSTVSCE